MEVFFENEEKGENCINQRLLPFPQCFLFCEGNQFSLERSNFVFSNYTFLCSWKDGLCLSVYPSVSPNLYRVIKAFTTFPVFICAKPCYGKRLLNVF